MSQAEIGAMCLGLLVLMSLMSVLMATLDLRSRGPYGSFQRNPLTWMYVVLSPILYAPMLALCVHVAIGEVGVFKLFTELTFACVTVCYLPALPLVWRDSNQRTATV